MLHKKVLCVKGKQKGKKMKSQKRSLILPSTGKWKPWPQGLDSLLMT